MIVTVYCRNDYKITVFIISDVSLSYGCGLSSGYVLGFVVDEEITVHDLGWEQITVHDLGWEQITVHDLGWEQITVHDLGWEQIMVHDLGWEQIMVHDLRWNRVSHE